MQKPSFGVLVATAVANLMAHGALAADSGKAVVAANDAGHCVHDCSGYAACKGNGNNSCKGKNDCAGQGQVPKACSSQATVDLCKKVLDPKNKKNTMCTWLTEK